MMQRNMFGEKLLISKNKWIKDYFFGRQITVMGLGLLGRGLNDIKFLAAAGARLTVTDLKSADELRTSLKQLRKWPVIKYVLGGHRPEDFCGRDFILRAANVPLNSPFISRARECGVPVKMDESWFAELMPAGVKIIGVTGTRGKTTTSHLIYEILRASRTRVFLAGNITGLATLPLLARVRAGDWVVLELSSWQLQGFGEARISPHIAVFTNFLPDHLNYYGGDLDKYFADKAHIFEYQKVGDQLVCSDQVANKIKLESGQKHVVADNYLPASWRLKILGAHNRANAGLAVKVGELVGAKRSVIKRAIENFAGVPDRLEFVGTLQGVKYYNDTTATTPEAVHVALQTLASRRRLILIFGGADKQLDLSSLFIDLPCFCRQLILLPGTGTDRLKKEWVGDRQLLDEAALATDMKKAVAAARAAAKSGDTVLLSPGFASFGLFKNEFDRGRQFRHAVENLSPKR